MAWARRILRGGLGVGGTLCAALGGYLGYLAVTGNFHQVVAGEVFRSAQVSAEDIAAYRGTYGIRSILNLRGAAPGEPWYDTEIAASAALGVTHVDFAMDASVQLTDAEATQLIALMREMPKPLLVHCRHGSDRTGLAMSLYLAAIKGQDEATAEGQLSLWFGHFAVPILSDAWPMDESWERLEPGLGFKTS
ncbi:MAG: protein tyrosine phosphatase [Acetobacteraceae bacterium]|nr:MAG: protein tyrosine phosphatase [Acetobacteraceae bacterium]